MEITQSDALEGHPEEEALTPMKEEAHHQPVRLRDCYPEPQRRVPQKGSPRKPTQQWRAGTRRERNP
jgi:hypothetical protein